MTLDQCKARLPMPELLARLHYDIVHGRMCCPFHEDKTPSFTIYHKGKWRFKCHSPGCRAYRGGDEKDFLVLHHVCSNSDAHRKYEEMVR